jgi:putative endonuclease
VVVVTTAGQRRALGAYGERVAARHLIAAGMVVLDRNWRCSVGELDLVLRDGEVLVACEVKTRTSVACGSPHEAVSGDKVARLHRLLWLWCEEHDVRPAGTRVDVVGVLRPAAGPALVDHLCGVA